MKEVLLPSHASSSPWIVDRFPVCLQYSRAIQAMGGVLEYYDDDRRFPLYGFGGRPGSFGPTLHCFAVNGNEASPEVTGYPLAGSSTPLLYS